VSSRESAWVVMSAHLLFALSCFLFVVVVVVVVVMAGGRGVGIGEVSRSVNALVAALLALFSFENVPTK
jgi:hypothetical protein